MGFGWAPGAVTFGGAGRGEAGLSGDRGSESSTRGDASVRGGSTGGTAGGTLAPPAPGKAGVAEARGSGSAGFRGRVARYSHPSTATASNPAAIIHGTDRDLASGAGRSKSGSAGRSPGGEAGRTTGGSLDRTGGIGRGAGTDGGGGSGAAGAGEATGEGTGGGESAGGRLAGGSIGRGTSSGTEGGATRSGSATGGRGESTGPVSKWLATETTSLADASNSRRALLTLIRTSGSLSPRAFSRAARDASSGVRPRASAAPRRTEGSGCSSARQRVGTSSRACGA